MAKYDRYLINCNYTNNSSRSIKYIVIHYTAGTTSRPGAALNTIKNTFNKPGVDASAHYVIDDDYIIQCVEDKDTAWHCGAKTYRHPVCRNNNSIGIEICSNHNNFISYTKNPATDKGWYFTEKALKNCKELVRQLMDKYKIPKENILMHYQVTGKHCPAPFLNNGGWVDFIQNIDKEDKEGVIMYKTIEEVPFYARSIISEYIDKGYIQGTGAGLNLTEEMVRLIVILDRVIKGGK